MKTKYAAFTKFPQGTLLQQWIGGCKTELLNYTRMFYSHRSAIGLKNQQLSHSES